MPGSGKEEFVAVAKELGFEVVRMGDVVREEAARNGIGNDDKGVGGFANEERKKHGFDIWAKRCVSRVKGNMTIIDGSRGTDELRVFQEAFGKNVQLVAVHSA
ncbi:MAG TPA: AAA family ATPase, partial [Methanomassiliicoccales archaeon]|nr:AAA family ATPase [Methanomassiliicoccales archaeon]